MEKELTINNQQFVLINNEKEAFEETAVAEKLTDYFDNYDIIVGDWAYGKLRLKGFNEKDNKLFNNVNDASKIESYIKNNCAYGCKWFAIKRK